MNSAVATTFKTSGAAADMKTMRFNNRERFALLLGFALWAVIGYHVIPVIFRWVVAWLIFGR